MLELDEEGIRHDVRQSIAHGFFSMMCATETGLSLAEAKRFVEIAADEAQGEILVTTSLILDSFEQNMELMLHAEEVGLDGVLLGYPRRSTRVTRRRSTHAARSSSTRRTCT
jgi:4-hydroxy-tetrahydrodipicolinate synthase